MKRPSKHSKAFAEAYDIERFRGQKQVNPNDFTPEESKLFEAFKEEKAKERSKRSHLKRKEEGTLKPKKKREEMDTEELERARARGSHSKNKAEFKKQQLRNAATSLGLAAPNISDVKIEELRAILSARLSVSEIQELEAQAAQAYEANPKERKEADEDGRRKPGPAKKTKPEPKPREMSPYLKLYLEHHPDHRPVATTTQLTPEENNAYQNWRHAWRKENEPDYVEMKRAQGKRWEAGHREKCSEASKKRRAENPEKERAAERKYEASEKGKATRKAYRAVYENLEETKERRKAWRQANRDKTLAYSRSYRERHLNKERARVLRQNAIRKGIVCDLSDAEQAAIRELPCGYCGDEADAIQITQKEMGKGYTAANSVPACKPCASTKLRFCQEDFVLTMANVAATHLQDEEWEYDYDYTESFKGTLPSSYQQYIKNAQSKGREFALAETQYEDLIHGGCFYCLFNDLPVGIDRVDNDQGYVTGNVVGACFRCNEMKASKPLGDFLEVATKVYKHVYKNK